MDLEMINSRALNNYWIFKVQNNQSYLWQIYLTQILLMPKLQLYNNNFYQVKRTFISHPQVVTLSSRLNKLQASILDLLHQLK